MRRLYSLWVMVHAVLVVNTPNMPSAMGTIKDQKSYVHTVKSRAVDRSTIQSLKLHLLALLIQSLEKIFSHKMLFIIKIIIILVK